MVRQQIIPEDVRDYVKHMATCLADARQFQGRSFGGSVGVSVITTRDLPMLRRLLATGRLTPAARLLLGREAAWLRKCAARHRADRDLRLIFNDDADTLEGFLAGRQVEKYSYKPKHFCPTCGQRARAGASASTL